MNQVLQSNKSYLRLIIIVSVAIPTVVAILLFAPLNFVIDRQSWITYLPAFNAVVNSITSALLVGAFISIKKQKVELHRNLMLAALLMGTLFLVSYVIYHASTVSTVFGDLDHDGILSAEELALAGNSRAMYLFILLSHIGLSIVVVPFVLLAFYFALSGQIDRHKKIVRYTFPVWLYVSVTGVIVYFMISPYY